MAQSPPGVDLTQISLEDLMNVQVTTVSKKEQNLSKVGAAVFVINREDIRRSGATSIPDLLRLVPGANVAQIDANTYAISIRAFNDRLADKVLVLIDGRTVYTPTTSGVYWDQQDVPLEDIDRIEVIRGPGGTVWGANAVNGVINIITQKARDTQGVLVTAGGGSQDTARGLVQFGGKAGQDGAYRIFENYSNTGNSPAAGGNSVAADGKSEAADGWHMFHSGFRSDWSLSPHDSLTVQGDFMQTNEGQTISVVYANQLPLMRTFNDAVSVGEGNLLGRWKHQFSNGSDTSLQVYYDRYDRRDEGVKETLGTFDLDFQHHLRLGSRNDVVWGFGLRFAGDSHIPGYGKTYIPLNQTSSLLSAFVQDEIAISDSLSFTIGSKFERQPYTGFQYAPSARLVWEPAIRQTIWLSASQAIKEVSREEVGLQIDPYLFPLPGGGFAVAQYNGNPSANPERLRDYELGYRNQLTKRFSLDLSAFSSYYHDLQTLDPAEPYFTTADGPPHLVLPYVFGNSADAHAYGAELSANWNIDSRWRMSASYTAIHLNVLLDPGSQDVNQTERADNTPENQFQVHSFVNLSHNLEWDSAMYYVGRLRDGGNGPVPAYTRVDSRFGWKIAKAVEFSVTGQNLLTPRHAEFHDAYEVRNTLIGRSVFAKLTLRF